MAMRVAVDTMGGDEAPAVIVEGAVSAAQHAEGAFEIILFGPEDQVRAQLDRHPGADGLAIEVVDAPDVIGMHEAPAAAIKSKRQSSIHLGLRAHREGKADAFVSAGNTGAVMGAALFILGRLPNVTRPSVIGFLPSTTSYGILLDVGTNVDCKPSQFVQFAQMGRIYAERVMKRENPVIALLNIGEEPGKGNEQIKAAYALLETEPGLNFKGNIEGRDLLHYAADVVVCDGFAGNVVLKFGESMATLIPQLMAQEMERQNLTEAERATITRVLGAVMRPFNYEEYGGAPLLGVNGNVIIGHGGSSARAVERMIMVAIEVARQDVAGSISAAVHA